ncbi:MAG: D-alanyl-D-alanine carboxypeptidase, partial [Hyphomicrobiaceae bacterium]|nr:D-alanyl-D-alanine carboxypeptidase [Hyphomicrobiaceae bacterium]
IAEHLAGSEREFAGRMTQKARQLGMSKTVFRNASGLPNHEQLTTAYDMALLAIHIRDHFPDHYHHFKTNHFKYKGKIFKNHNVLLRKPGVDGIKTGYIRASGFNLVASVSMHQRRIVAVVMGGNTSRDRNIIMDRLLKKNVPLGSTVVTRQPNIRFLTSKNLRPFHQTSLVNVTKPKIVPQTICKPHVIKVGLIRATGTEPQLLGEKIQVAPQSSGLDFAKSILLEGRIRHNDLADNLCKHNIFAEPYVRKNQAVVAKKYNERLVSTFKTHKQFIQEREHIRIQIGAFYSFRNANQQLLRVLSKAGSLVSDYHLATIPVIVGKEITYRAELHGNSFRKAAKTCQQLKNNGIECVVIRAR